MNQVELTVGLSLTEKCNELCGHCYIGRKNLWKDEEYQTVEIHKGTIDLIIPKMIRANVKRLNFGGGEAPLHPDFIPIVQDLNEAGIKVSLTTNGSTFPIYKDYLHLFNDIGVSIDFPDERHSVFRGREKAFDWGLRTLRELVEAEVKTELVSCIMSINYKLLPDIYELAHDIGVDMWRLNRFHSSRNDLQRFQTEDVRSLVTNMNSALSLTPEQMHEAFTYLASVSPKPENQHYAIPDPLFRTMVDGRSVTLGGPYGKIALRIKSNGDVTPNVFTDEVSGNIINDELTDILDDITFEEYRNPTRKDKCQVCKSYPTCQGGDKTDSYLLLGDKDMPDPYCNIDPNKVTLPRLIDVSETSFVHETYLGTIYVPIRWDGK